MKDDAFVVVGVLALAAVTALAHLGPASSGGASTSAFPSGSSGGSGGSGGGRASASRSASPARAVTTGPVALPACSAMATAPSVDGRRYVRYPVSAGGSPTCGMAQGSRGEAVEAVQRAMGLCMQQPLAVDGVYGPRTSQAVAMRGGGPGVGAYGASTARQMRWPVYSTSTNRFTGRCSPAGVPA